MLDIFLIIVTIISIIITIIAKYNRKRYDIELDEQNKQIAKLNIELQHESDKLQNKVSSLKYNISNLEDTNHQLNTENALINNEIQLKQSTLDDLQENIRKSQEVSKSALENYSDILMNNYNTTEAEYEILIDELKKSYEDLQDSYMRESAQCKTDLEKIKSTRVAAIEAARREKEIKENTSFYCLQVSSENQSDIQKLENVKKTLNSPRILSMLIWSTYFQKQLKTLSANILGLQTICGIYKITNIITGECYIGQSVDIAKRWVDHAKCGLGIDTPQGNKLYAAMQEYSLWNFSWECLEQCPREELNEKEKFYIELYQSSSVGYNSTNGNN